MLDPSTQRSGGVAWLSLAIWILIPMANFFYFRSVSQRAAMAELCKQEAAIIVTDFAVLDDKRTIKSLGGSTPSANGGSPLQQTPCPSNDSNNNSNIINNNINNEISSHSHSNSNSNNNFYSLDNQYYRKFLNNSTIKGCGKADAFLDINLEFVDSKKFDKWRSDTMASMQFPFHTSILQLSHTQSCSSYDSFWTDLSTDSCAIVVYVNNSQVPYPSLRYDDDVNEAGISTKNPWHHSDGTPPKAFSNELNTKYFQRPVGTFRKLPRDKGRVRLKEKMFPLLENFDGPTGIAKQVKLKLSTGGFKKGDDITVMVVNEGEIDLYMNFACSCQLHDLSLKNLLVFAGSHEIVQMIEMTGAMALYNPAYGSVSKRASHDYLDRVFVDMMWYKCFSIFLVLRLGLNVLFQDVDLVWFRNPFPYFHDYINARHNKSMISGSHIEAFYSDDGQRSLRYAPYFANSGFYYYVATERSLYLSWAIMISFDNVQLLGSHQNVMTTRLVEGLSLSHNNAKIISIEDFPTGYQFHHERGYMRKFKEKSIHPYNFHMCWTQGKPDKLRYMREIAIWYLSETCSPLENLIPDGSVWNYIHMWRQLPSESQTKSLRQLCCSTMPGAP
jgi:hypothetical protein